MQPSSATKSFVFLYTNQRVQHKQFISHFGKKFPEIHLLSTHLGLEEVVNRKIRFRVAMTPNDFLSEIKYASLIVTASFHCLAFAILLQKPFMAILSGKPGKDERLLNLLRLTGLSNRILTTQTTYQDMMAPIDYSKVQKILQTEIDRSEHFLYQAITGIHNEN
ncbi:MAG: polysaccharide pyruvyl transferase family protein [Elusimicrobiaceae bacterium]|nr:polysaccharide pyruvyl transferase family protein [Elusimicrobiaceae bacterium]